MTIFADASALVKLYVNEQESDVVESLAPLTVSSLSRVEVSSAIWSKRRNGNLTAAEAATVARRIATDFRGSPAQPPRFESIPLGRALLDRAVELVAAHPLRAGDAIQLASALAIREVVPDCRTFACFDGRLRDAAAKTGFELLPG